MRAKEGRVFIGRLPYRSDLLSSLTVFCKKEGVKSGVFWAVGALTKTRLGYYDQDAKKYVESLKLDKKLEIASCMGNISLKDGQVFVHAHITLADRKGACYGGHLMPGSAIFAAEYCIKELKGVRLEREDDPQTGLSLWKAKGFKRG